MSSTELRSDLHTVSLGLDVTWLVLTASGIVLTQVGFALLESSVAKRKDEKTILFKNLLDHSIASMSWYFLGWKIFQGIFPTFLPTEEINYARIFQQFGFEITTSSIVSACVLGRIRMDTYLCFSAFLASFSYPMVAYACWNPGGFLARAGFKDFGGGLVVHVFGGVNGIIASYLCGRSAVSNVIANNPAAISSPSTASSISPQVNSPNPQMMTFGGLILYVAWFFVNAGSSGTMLDDTAIKSAGRAALNTSLAAGAASLQGYLICTFSKGRLDLGLLVNSLLSGLIAITAPCGFVLPHVAALIGFIAPWVYLKSTKVINQLSLEDPLDAISVHFVCGLLGTLLLGLFHPNEGLLYTLQPKLFIVQIFGSVGVILWGLFTATPFFYVAFTFNRLSYSESVQNLGLDAYYFGEYHEKKEDQASEVI